MKTVEFDRYTPPYNPGERATFADAEADVFINGGAAHLIGADEQPGSPNQSQVITPEMKQPYPPDNPQVTVSTKPAGGEEAAGDPHAGNQILAGKDATGPAKDAGQHADPEKGSGKPVKATEAKDHAAAKVAPKADGAHKPASK